MNWNRSILRVLARLRESDLKDDGRGSSERAGMLNGMKKGGGADRSGLPVVCLLSALLLILLCALSRNAVFTVTVLAVLLARAAVLPIRQLKRVMQTLLLPCMFTLIIMLPAVFLGSPKTMLTVTLKVAEAVLALSLMGTAVSFQRLTEAFRQLHFPELFVLVLDLSIRYLVILGHYSGALLEAVTMRSVGTVSWKHSGAGGILGTTFLKSQQMAQQTEEAMRLRGFDGAYPALSRSRFGLRDVLILSADVLALLFFVYTQMRTTTV